MAARKTNAGRFFFSLFSLLFVSNAWSRNLLVDGAKKVRIHLPYPNLLHEENTFDPETISSLIPILR